MSRLLMSLSLVTALVSSAFADADQPGTPRFSKPPPQEQRIDMQDRVEIEMPPIRLDRATVRAKLGKQRARSLAFFRAYQKKGVFPNNTFSSQKLNVWRDDAGNYCAAATILRMSGQTALAEKVGDENNFIRLADVEQGPLMDWILTSGLTQAEIAAIQEPFMPVADPLEQPTKGPSVAIPSKRRAEDQRLKSTYTRVEAQIVKSAQRSLDLATDRLMNNPELAARFVQN